MWAPSRILRSSKDAAELRFVYDFVSAWLTAEAAGRRISSAAGLGPWNYKKLTKDLNLAGGLFDVL